MRRLLPILAAALLGSALTAAAIVLPARASGDAHDRDERDRGVRAGPLLLDPERAPERIEEFEACMRENGFDLGDETTLRITPDGVWLNGEKVDRERFREAQRECGPPFRFAPPGLDDLPELERLPDAVPPELRERLEQFRRCVRERDETTGA
jgi:hypothetical protein